LLPQDLSCTSKYPYETGLGPVATLASPVLAIRKNTVGPFTVFLPNLTSTRSACNRHKLLFSLGLSYIGIPDKLFFPYIAAPLVVRLPVLSVLLNLDLLKTDWVP